MENKNKKLSFKSKVGYGLGDFGGCMTFALMGPIFVAYCTDALLIDTVLLGTKWCTIQKEPSYCYLFNHSLPGDTNGAWHSSDLWYFFGTLKNCWRPMNEDDYLLSDYMVDYLTNFVKTGNPNSSELPIWNPSKKKEKKLCILVMD